MRGRVPRKVMSDRTRIVSGISNALGAQRVGRAHSVRRSLVVILNGEQSATVMSCVYSDGPVEDSCDAEDGYENIIRLAE